MNYQDTNNEITFEDHNRELIHRLVPVGIIWLLVFVISTYFSDKIINLIEYWGKLQNYKFVALAPQEALLQTLKISAVLGIVVALPFFLVQAFLFIAPAIESVEIKKKTVGYSLIGFVAFCIGVAFSIFIILPFVFNFLTGVSNSLSIDLTVSLEKYISFTITMLCIFGVAFELPIVMKCLNSTKLDCFSKKSFKKAFSFVAVLLFFVSAFITPPDVMSMILVALPLNLLYGIGIIVSKNYENHTILADKI